jgi:putative peptidoglycan lipid II flippase
LLQWLWLLYSCWRDGVAMKLVRPRFTPRVRQLVKLATPVAIGGGAQQVSTMLDVVWASLLPAGSISALYYADRISQLPLGVIGIAVGTALLPLLARQLRAGQDEAAMANQNRAIEFGLLFSLPSMAALWILAEPMIRVLFEHGKFGPDDTMRTAGALVAYSVGLPAFMLVKALTPGFFAREDTRTPLYTAIVSIAVNIALNAVFVLATPLAQFGIALSSSISGWLNVALLAIVLRRRGHWHSDERLVSRAWRIGVATIGMSAALWFGMIAVRAPLAFPNLMGVAALAGIIALGGAVYGLLGMALGVIRIGELRAALRRPTRATPGVPDAPP